jgi:hypothetical protein
MYWSPMAQGQRVGEICGWILGMELVGGADVEFGRT